MPRIYVVDVDETKPATRLIEADTTAGAHSFVSKEIISVRLATQSDMYDMAKRGIEVEDSKAATPIPPGAAGQAQP